MIQSRNLLPQDTCIALEISGDPPARPDHEKLVKKFARDIQIDNNFGQHPNTPAAISCKGHRQAGNSSLISHRSQRMPANKSP